MDKVLLLTKNDCPNCKNLKLFLKMALGDKYAPDILEVHQLDQADQFKELISKYQITSTPALIFNNEVVRYFQPQDVVSFLHKHLGKR